MRSSKVPIDEGVPMSFLTISLVCSPGDSCWTNSFRGMKPWVVKRGSQAQRTRIAPSSISVGARTELLIRRLVLVDRTYCGQ